MVTVLCVYTTTTHESERNMKTIKNSALVSDLRSHSSEGVNVRMDVKWGVNCPNCHYADTFIKRAWANNAKRAHVCTAVAL